MLLRLKLLRLAHGHSQWQIGRTAGMSQGRYSMIERGLIRPTAAERHALAKALGTEPMTLFRQIRPLGKRGSTHASASRDSGGPVRVVDVAGVDARDVEVASGQPRRA